MNFCISQITFRGGSKEIKFNNGDITIVVGPNSIGKTTLLREIFAAICSEDPKTAQGKIVDSVETTPHPSVADFKKWLEQSMDFSGDAGFSHLACGTPFVQRHAGKIVVGNLADNKLPAKARGHLVSFANNREAMAASNRIEARDPDEYPPTSPMHLFCDNEEKLKTIQNSIESAFPGNTLHVDPRHSRHIDTYFGPPQPHPDRIANIKKEMRRLPEEGSGVQAFAGMILCTQHAEYPIALIDEPETFLHPPQARVLGRVLLENSPKHQQVFIATHSVDILHGLLDTAESCGRNVRIIRISQSNKTRRISEIDKKTIDELRKDYCIRGSGVLNGLFFDTTVMCEGDIDAIFYRAIEEVVRSKDESTGRAPDVFFCSAGGKGGALKAQAALKRAGMDVRAIVDMDGMRRDSINALTASLPEEEQRKLKNLSEKIEEKLFVEPELNVEQAAAQIRALPLEDFVKAAGEVIGKAKSTNRWKECVKQGYDLGVDPLGFSEAIDLLDPHGIYLVPVGELEAFGAPGTKKQWLENLYTHYGEEWPRHEHLAPARNFIQKVVTQSR